MWHSYVHIDVADGCVLAYLCKAVGSICPCKMLADVNLQEQSSTIKEKEVKLQKEEEMCKQEHEMGKQLMEDGTDELTQGITENDM